MWLVLFIYQSFNILPRNEWELREGAMKAAPILREILTAHLKTQQGMKEHIVDWLAKGSAYEVSNSFFFLFSSPLNRISPSPPDDREP